MSSHHSTLSQRSCMINLGAANFCSVSVLPLDYLPLLIYAYPYSFHMCFILQAYFHHVHSCDLVSLLSYEIFHGRLLQTGIFISHFLDDVDNIPSRTLQLPTYFLQQRQRSVDASFATLQGCARPRLQGKMPPLYTVRAQYVTCFCCSN